MNRNEASPRLDCRIGLFGQVEPDIEDITERINQAADVAEKARLAAELHHAVAPLLDCEAYDHNDVNCRLCREFSQLRGKTADMIQMAARLAR